MTGAILCGGQSTRMHKDKGLLIAGRFTWAEKMARLLQPFVHNLVISVNPEQHAYRDQLAGFTFVTDDELLDIYGPLHGLLSVHQQIPDDDIFLLACDMQKMQSEVLDALAEKYRENAGFEAWVYAEPDGSPEPLAAIYSAKALASILAMHRLTPLPRHSMKYVLDQLKVYTLPILEAWTGCFANFNTPPDADLPILP